VLELGGVTMITTALAMRRGYSGVDTCEHIRHNKSGSAHHTEDARCMSWMQHFIKGYCWSD